MSKIKDEFITDQEAEMLLDPDECQQWLDDDMSYQEWLNLINRVLTRKGKSNENERSVSF